MAPHLLEEIQARLPIPSHRITSPPASKTAQKRLAEVQNLIMVDDFRPDNIIKLAIERRAVPVQVNDLHIEQWFNSAVLRGQLNGIRICALS